MPDTRVRKVTIFVSSPKDVAAERGRVQAVTAKLNREYEGLVWFETVRWEEHFYTAAKSFQPQIPAAVASDIVVSIFWTRIGSRRLPPHAKREALSVGDGLRAAHSPRGLEGGGRARCLCVPQDCRCDVADGGRGAAPASADPARRARGILERMVQVGEG